MDTKEQEFGFSEQEIRHAFQLIAEAYFNRNFGTMAKADFETLLFSIYIEHCLDNGLPYDDHTLSRTLGIGQNRVRALKLKKELKYPYESFCWKKAFVECISGARYDEVKRLVKVAIPDVNVLTELRSYLESQGWYDEYQLNPKLFQCRADIFLQLCRSLDQEGSAQLSPDAKDTLRDLEKEAKSQEEKSALKEILSGSMEDGMKKLAISASKEILQAVLNLLPFGGLAGKAIRAFADVLQGI